MTITPDLTKKQERRIDAKVRDAFERLARFTEDRNAVHTPARLRKPHTREGFASLTVEQRADAMRANLRTQVVASVVVAKPEPETPRPTVAARPPAPASYLVSCADGCGTFVPARSHRPVVAYAAGHRPARRRPKRSGD